MSLATTMLRAGSRGVSLPFAFAILLMTAGFRPCRSAEAPAWPAGHWRVVDRGLGLECRLTSLEVRPAGRSGDAIVIAYEADGDAKEKVWGSGRLNRQALAGDRPMRADWVVGPMSVSLELTPLSGGRLGALLRQRDRDHPESTGERVRQLVLAQDRGAGATVEVRGSARKDATGAARDAISIVYVIGADGSGLRAVAPPDGFTRAAHPSWSPDGKWIAFTAFDATGRDPLIRVVAAEGGPTVAVAAGVGPRWSSDGGRIAYMASGRPDFATDWNAIGRNDERIESVRISGPHAGDVEVLARGIWPRWSPTDDRLAFVASIQKNADVYIRSADGLGVIRLTDDPSTDTTPLWTKDGASIVYLSDRGNRWDLYKIRADGQGEAERLTDGQRREDGADLSPEGARVAFTDRANRPDSQILLLDLARGSARPLSPRPQSDRDPAWSPDGRSIAFVSRRPSPMLPVAPGSR